MTIMRLLLIVRRKARTKREQEIIRIIVKFFSGSNHRLLPDFLLKDENYCYVNAP